MSYAGNIELEARKNEYFRNVLYTDPDLQLVVMSLAPREDIGSEVHNDVDQFIRVESGEGKAVIGGVETVLGDGMAVVVSRGVPHNIINTSGSQALKLYTIYAPAHHPDKTIHKTKADAQAAEMSEH